MTRLLFTLVPIVMVMALANGAPVPQIRFEERYDYHGAVGDRFVYECRTDGKYPIVMTDLVTSVDVLSSGLRVVTTNRTCVFDGHASGRVLIRRASVSPRGMYGRVVEDPDAETPVVRLPPVIGDKCVCELRGGCLVDEVVWTTQAVERVTVPAGSFRAVRVKCQTGECLPRTDWYTPSIGLVMSVEGKTVTVLTSVSRAGKLGNSAPANS